MALEPEKTGERKLTELVEALRKLSDATSSKASQDFVRRRVFRRISQLRRPHELPKFIPWYAQLISQIREIAEQTIPSPALKVLLREKILAFIQPRQSIKSLFANLFSKKAWAMVTVFVFILGVFSYGFFSSPDTAKAAPHTYILSVEGNVEILRKGKSLPAKPFLSLKDQDTIRTKQNSSAVIRFLDDSITRLAENTELTIERLFANQFDQTKTIVELTLRKGRAWSRILNLVDKNSKFEVKSKKAVATAKKKAAFDMTVDAQGKTKVEAMENAIEVRANQNKKKEFESTIAKGFAVEVNNGSVKVKPQKEPETIAKDAWITQNIEKDAVYEQDFIDKGRESRQEIVAFTPLASVKTLSETAKNIFKSGIEKQTSAIKAVEAKLIQAEILLEEEHMPEAESLLVEFAGLFADAAQKIHEIEKEDPEKALVLKEGYERLLNNYEKQFTIFLSDQPQYKLKETIEKAKITFAVSAEEKIEKTLDIAGERLLEAQKLASQGQEVLATEALQEYKSTIENTVSENTNLPETEKEEAVKTLLEKKEEHLKILGAMSQEVSLKEPPLLKKGEQRGVSLKEILAEATKNSLATVKEAVKTSNAEGPSEEVLEKLESIGEIEVNGKSVVDVKITDQNISVESTLIPLAAEPPKPEPADLRDVFQKTQTEFSGVTVITIEAAPSPPLPMEEGSKTQE